MTRQELFDKRVEERVKEELTPVNANKRYDEMLDEVSGEIRIGSITFDASRVLEELDPIAYRCGFSDWLDGAELEEIDGEYYEQSEVDDIKEETENEIEESDFIRICDECGKVMQEGYCIGGGQAYYCSDECLHKATDEVDREAYDIGGDNSDSYWTNWEWSDEWARLME